MIAKELKEGDFEPVQVTQNTYMKYKQAIIWLHPDRFAIQFMPIPKLDSTHAKEVQWK